MPWGSREKHRAYQAEYNKRPEQVDRRVQRNAARRDAIRQYGKAALEGKDIDHIQPLDQGGDNEKRNLRPISLHKNRGFARDRNNQPKR